jgi:hypothetical protein
MQCIPACCLGEPVQPLQTHHRLFRLMEHKQLTQLRSRSLPKTNTFLKRLCVWIDRMSGVLPLWYEFQLSVPGLLLLLLLLLRSGEDSSDMSCYKGFMLDELTCITRWLVCQPVSKLT